MTTELRWVGLLSGGGCDYWMEVGGATEWRWV